jgi:hypothetical protein
MRRDLQLLPLVAKLLDTAMVEFIGSSECL